MWLVVVSLKKNRLNLYDIKPQNVLSKDVESLSSYLSRLARAHVVDIKRLALEVRNIYRSEKGLRKITVSNNLLSVNSVNRANRSLVLGLLKCTGNKDVKYLSLFALDNKIKSRRLIKKSAFWCPHCLYNMKLNHSIIYIKLIWQMEIVFYCEKHNIRLENQCPSCLKTMNYFNNVGFCNVCGYFLGHINVTSEKKLPYEYWINDQIGNLFENLDRLNNVSYCSFLKSIFPISTKGRYTRFQRFTRKKFPYTVRAALRISKYNFDDGYYRSVYVEDITPILRLSITYHNGFPPYVYPTIGQLLQYCYVSGSKLSTLMLGEVSYDDWNSFNMRPVPTVLYNKIDEREK